MSEVPWYVSLIIARLPFILFIVAFGWIGNRVGSRLTTTDGMTLAQLVDQYGRELKRSNDLAEQAISDLRARFELLDKRG
jgi:hypothetical protein